MRDLTALQRKVLASVQQHFRCFGRTPTYRQIATRLGVGVRSAFQHVQALERKGILERAGRRIELLGDYLPPVGLPVLGRVAAGSPILAAQNIEDYVDVAGVLKDENVFLLKIKGASMTGAGIHDGDQVIVRRQSKMEPGEIGVVVVNEEATVKRVWQQGTRIRLVSENPEFEPLVFDTRKNDVRIAGKVIGAIRLL